VPVQNRGAGGSATVDFATIGSHSVPTWCAEPTDSNSTGRTTRGFSLLQTNTKAVAAPAFAETP